MRIISIKTTKEFWQKSEYSDSEQALKAWYYEVMKENWNTPNDIKVKYKNASILSGNRVVFNIKGNKYRLIVAIRYDYKLVFIRFIGTHKQYDKINAKNI